MKYHTLGDLNKKLCFSVLEAEKYSIKVSANSVSGENLLGLQIVAFLLYPHRAKTKNKFPGFLFL